jgi:Winged helix-turn helix
MVRRAVTLTENQRQELLQLRDHDPRPYARERGAAILKIAEGQSPHRVARSGLLKPRDPDTVYAWLDRYQAEGVAGLIAHPHGGSRGRYL